MLKVCIPNVCQNEQRYALDIILGEFLGLAYEVETYESEFIEIIRTGGLDNSAKLSLDASFFHKAHQAWLKAESMPVFPLASWQPADEGIEANLVEQSVPVVYGQPGLVKSENYIHLNLDIFGSAFFMLSRYEELITEDRDNHDRFPAWASVAYKTHFLDRPIVNEYLEIFWSSMQILWPDLHRKQRNASNFITCDTDWPFDPTIYSFKRMVKSCGRQVLKELSPLQAFKTFSKYVMYKIGVRVRDEYRENISWMMDVNEQAGNKVAFYFITHKTSALDTDEDFDSSKIRALFQEVYQRGHEIGLHPGYETFNNSGNFTASVKKLQQVFDEENITQQQMGGRMHFLRWDTSQTPHLWEQNGLDYDSTLSFADKTGFRCGVCYEFTMYDLVNRKPFKLKQRPLIVMECTVIASRYENLGYAEESMMRFEYFKQACHKFDGEFTLLWHNSHFENTEDKIFYKKLIQ